MSGAPVFTRIFVALAQRPGRNTTLATLASLTKLEPEQVARVISHARRSKPWFDESLTVVRPGHEWIYNPRVNDERTPEQIVKENEVGSAHIWKQVLEALMNSGPNENGTYPILHKDELAKQLGMRPSQVVNAMNTILRSPDTNQNVDVIWRSNSWRWKSNTAVASSPVKGANPTAGPDPDKTIRGQVLQQLVARPGQVVFLNELMEDTGLNRSQVQNAVHHMRTRVGSLARDIEVINAGNAWSYVPNRDTTPTTLPPAKPRATRIATTTTVVSAPPSTPTTTFVAPAEPAKLNESSASTNGHSKRLFEEIGVTTDGNVLARGDDSKLYVITEF